jgi:hypothetical protein
MPHRSLLLEEGGMLTLVEWGTLRSYPAVTRGIAITLLSHLTRYADKDLNIPRVRVN